MADEPISALTLIAAPTGTPPYPTAFTNPSTGALLEILDQTNTAMAPTGTNSAIAPGHLLKGFLNAGANVTITETSGIVTIAGAPVTSNYVASALGSSVTVTGTGSTYASIGLTVILPTLGTYILLGSIRAGLTFAANAVGNQAFISTQFYDTTNSIVVPNSATLACFLVAQEAPTAVSTQQVTTMGPFFYSPATAPATITLQGLYNPSSGSYGLATIPQLLADGNGITTINAVQII